MPLPLVTAFYAALFALLIIILAARVSFYRVSAKIGLGDNGDRQLAKRIRVHGNAVEYLPIALLLMLLLELLATAPVWLHVFGVALLIGRLLHAFGLSRSGGTSPGRLYGIGLTWLVILVMAAILLWQSVMWWLTTN